MPPSCGKRVKSSTTRKAVGRKKRKAGRSHSLNEDVQLCAAAAIQRGPRTAAMLRSSTSQKPITRRRCDFALAEGAPTSTEGWLMLIRPGRESVHLVRESCAETDLSKRPVRPTCLKKRPGNR